MKGSQDTSEPAERSPERIVQLIIEHVAERTGEAERELPPLFESIDPDALSRLYTSAGIGESSLSVEFTYAGRLVRIDADGTVVSTPV